MRGPPLEQGASEQGVILTYGGLHSTQSPPYAWIPVAAYLSATVLLCLVRPAGGRMQLAHDPIPCAAIHEGADDHKAGQVVLGPLFQAYTCRLPIWV